MQPLFKQVSHLRSYFPKKCVPAMYWRVSSSWWSKSHALDYMYMYIGNPMWPCSANQNTELARGVLLLHSTVTGQPHVLNILWRVMVKRLRAPDSSSSVWPAECGFESRSWHLLNVRKIGDVHVVISALPARLRTDDTQAYISMYCKKGNPVSALGVGSNGLWIKRIVAHTLKWPSGLVCLATWLKKNK